MEARRVELVRRAVDRRSAGTVARAVDERAHAVVVGVVRGEHVARRARRRGTTRAVDDAQQVVHELAWSGAARVARGIPSTCAVAELAPALHEVVEPTA